MKKRYAYWLVGGLLLAAAMGAASVIIDVAMRWVPDGEAAGVASAPDGPVSSLDASFPGSRTATA